MLLSPIILIQYILLKSPSLDGDFTF